MTVKSISVVISLQTSLKKDQCKHLKSVHVSADFYGKYQSNQEAKHSKSLVFNDISHFRCLVMMHKLNYILNLRHRHDRPLTHPAVSSLGGPKRAVEIKPTQKKDIGAVSQTRKLKLHLQLTLAGY